MTPGTFAAAHAVYTVTAPALDPSKPFYVGACPLDKLARMPDARRNTEWRARMTDYEPVVIAIIGLCATADDASRAQAFAVENWQPWANVNGTIVTTGRRVRCLETGLIYDNASAAARIANVSPQAMSQHLTGTGAKTCGGFTFERCE